MTDHDPDLPQFYQSPLGRQVQNALTRRLQSVWPSVRGDFILGFGYTAPLLEPFIGLARKVQTVSDGFGEKKSRFEEASVDRVVLLHALERVDEPILFLQDVRRILKKGGKAVFIVVDRRGLWAHNDQTPFGTGRPYSRRQLYQALTMAGFEGIVCSRTIHFPPNPRFSFLAEPMEKYGNRYFSGFGGLLFVEAEKRFFAPIATGVVEVKRRSLFSFPSAPVPSCRIR